MVSRRSERVGRWALLVVLVPLGVLGSAAAASAVPGDASPSAAAATSAPPAAPVSTAVVASVPVAPVVSTTVVAATSHPAASIRVTASARVTRAVTVLSSRRVALTPTPSVGHATAAIRYQSTQPQAQTVVAAAVTGVPGPSALAATTGAVVPTGTAVPSALATKAAVKEHKLGTLSVNRLLATATGGAAVLAVLGGGGLWLTRRGRQVRG
jgi:hypothetical protein